MDHEGSHDQGSGNRYSKSMSGAELRRIREGMGWTQEQLAKRLDIHRLTISRWEQDHVPIPRTVEMVLEKIPADES